MAEEKVQVGVRIGMEPNGFVQWNAIAQKMNNMLIHTYREEMRGQIEIGKEKIEIEIEHRKEKTERGKEHLRERPETEIEHWSEKTENETEH